MPGTTLARGNIGACWIIGPSFTPVAVAQNTSAEQSFTVSGLQSGDFVDVYANVAQTAGVGIVNSRVSAVNTLTLSFSNSTGGSVTPAAGQYAIIITRPEFFPLPTSAG
jgi:hypothetical protein